ncbi:MAG: M48 family metalloprotease [Arenicellales bacterium]
MLIYSPHSTWAQALPELSDSAALVLNAEQEKMLGKQVMLNVRARSTLSDDTLLHEYLNALTAKLSQHSPRDFGQISLQLAIDPNINAFAVPGGYITINSGLIKHANSEDELAAVIAHEIGHHSQRHISRMIERQKQLSLPATAALLGGLIVGGQVGTAAVLSAQAALGADQLSYSRQFEIEADASGMAILTSANYPAKAMPAFFSQLEKQSQLYGGISPEFLRTHPVSSDRIADAHDRAKRLSTPQENPAPLNAQLDFAHAKARSLALYGEPLSDVIAQFELAAAAPEAHIASQYGLMLVRMRKGELKQARAVLDQLLMNTGAPPIAHALYELELAQLSLKQGKLKQALDLFASLYSQDKNQLAAIQGYALSLIQNQDFARASRILRKALRHHPDTVWLYTLLGQSYGAQNKTLNALLIKTQQMQHLGQYEQALTRLKQSKQSVHADDSLYLQESISALTLELTEQQQQLKAFKL